MPDYSRRSLTLQREHSGSTAVTLKERLLQTTPHAQGVIGAPGVGLTTGGPGSMSSPGPYAHRQHAHDACAHRKVIAVKQLKTEIEGRGLSASCTAVLYLNFHDLPWTMCCYANGWWRWNVFSRNAPAVVRLDWMETGQTRDVIGMLSKLNGWLMGLSWHMTHSAVIVVFVFKYGFYQCFMLAFSGMQSTR